MAKLNISFEGNSLGEFNIDKERITIGRRVGNDIHIDNLAISGDHALITTIGDDSFLQDLDSTNGTLVNSKAIKKHVLHHGDIIEFGKHQIVYVNLLQQKSRPERSGFENTAVMRPRPAKLNIEAIEAKAENEKNQNNPISEPNIDNIAQLPQAPPAIESKNLESSMASTSKSAHLKILNGATAGQELPLNKALTTLGQPGVQLAVITKRLLGYFITHVEGKNMPLVNGQIIGAQAHALSDHDVIELEGIKLELYLAQA